MSKTRTFLVMAAVFFMTGCHGCTKPKHDTKPDEVVEKKDDVTGFALSAQQIFAHANYFSYQSEMQVTTKKGASSEEDFEAIEIKGAKPRLWLKKKIDSQHFIEVVAEGETFLVKSGGKEFRRGSDNTPLYQSLIDDGFNLLDTILRDFDLTSRVVVKQDGATKKVYTVPSGPVSAEAPFVQALLKKTPAFGEVIASDASGSFTVDEKSGLPLSGTMSLTVSFREERTLSLKASFNLETHTAGEPLVMPVVRDDDLASYPVDVGRRFNDLLNTKESK